MRSSTPIAIVIAGPTAIGKTALAIRLARYFSTSIISADSRQCFRELNIGVAKPSADELTAARHFFINSHSINDKVDAGVYESFALQSAAEIFLHQPVAIVTGGTGMYIRAFCEGLDKIPEIQPLIRQAILQEYTSNGLAWLTRTVEQEDPEYFASGEIKNPQRLLRALEIKRSSGKSIRAFQLQQPVARPFDVIKIGLELPRPALVNRINQRVEIMLQEGLQDEVKTLLPYQQLNALQTVGYKEIFDYLNGLSSLDAATELIKINTRQYAKRQMTWFKKDKEFIWFSPFDFEGILEHINASIGTYKL